MLGWDPLTVIRDSNDLFIRFNPERDGDLRTWCILDGIVEQVTENLGQADSIGLNEAGRYNILYDLKIFMPALNAHDQIPKERIQPDRLKFHRHAAALQTRRIEDTVDQGHELVRLFVNDGQEFMLGLGIPNRIRTK